IMLVGEAPGLEEDKTGSTFMGQDGELLKKMLIAINIKKENIYSTYAVNFRTPEDRKPTSSEIKRYSQYLQKHISIINPKIIILMGSTAMESLTGLNNKISSERGKWREIIVKNTSYNVIITFNPSYLLRVPENKKHSWEDLKKIKQKITDLKLRF
ncbi:uracil-DNA glycosylase, partial [Candidatus Pelagibacter sp.]|nr:uracil-DNA glycosylase [Candidatus Pelagibacter sp.]